MKPKSLDSLILVVCILLCWIVPNSIWAKVQVDGIYYNLNSEAKTAEVTFKAAYSESVYSGDVIIPESFICDGQSYTVTGIGWNAFCCPTITYEGPHRGLTSVTIPNSVTYIYFAAFVNCVNLTTVKIGSGLNYIEFDGGPFEGCTSLTSIIVDANNTTFDSRDNCNAIIETSTNTLIVGCENTVIPNSVTSIGGEAFSRCTNLLSVTIPNSVASISYEAFSDCTGLTSIIVEGETPASVESSSFDNVDKSNCTLYVPTGSKTAYENAEGWSDFQNIVEYTPELDVFATGSCGDNVTYTIYSDMSMVVSGTGEMYDYDSDSQINNDYSQSIEKVIIEDGVTTIGLYAFSNCIGLTSVTIPNSITSIRSSAFEGCIGLASTVIPGSVRTICSYAFSGCSGLTSLIISNGVETLCEASFAGCTGLTSIEIPESVSYIDVDSEHEGVFLGCSNLESISVNPNNSTYDSRDNCNAIIETSSNELIVGCKTTVIPNGVCGIIKDAFYGCIGLTSINIPSSLSYIDVGYSQRFEAAESPFMGCTNLSSIIVDPNNGTYDSREDCNAIIETSTNTLIFGCKSSVIPQSVTAIGDCAFWGCLGLNSLTIPNSLAEIGDYAFSNCTSLTSIMIERRTPPSAYISTFSSVDKTNCTLYVPTGSKTAYENAEGWSEFQNIVEYTSAPEVLATGSCGDDVIYTIFSDKSMVISGTGAMTDFTINYDDDTINRENNDYWTQVKTVTIEEGVTSIGDYAFSNCAELTSVSIPNSVNSIGTSAFFGCSTLTSITIPASVGTIGADALSYSGLTHIYIEDSDDELQFEQVTFYMEDYEDPLEYVYLGRNIRTKDFWDGNPWQGVGGFPPFSNSSNLHTLEIGDKVTYLEDWSFSNAPLQSLVIGSNVQSIGIRSLSSANGGQTLVIPSNVKRMGDYSLSPSISTLVLEKGDDDLEIFAGYNSLELSFYGSESSIDSIYVGRNLTCSSNNIHVECRSASFDASLHRIMNTTGEEDEFDLTEYYIPPVCATNYYFGSGASIGEYYFQNSPVEHVYNLRSSRVGRFAFFNSNVKTVSFDTEGSTTIGNGVFSDCDGLTTLSFPEGMTDIGDNAFMNCRGLTSITIPSSLQSIGGYSFYVEDIENCVPLNVYISDLSSWCSMDIGFMGNPLIRGHLIYNGEEVTDLVVPEEVQSIGMGAFDGYSSLTSVVIPKGVTSIGERAFYCTGLTSVTMESAVPLTIEGSTFEEVDKTTCILYVPAGSKTAYENASYWSEFENIVEYGDEPDTDISALDNAIYVDHIDGRIGGTKVVSVKMKDNYDVCAFQFIMRVPEGVTITGWNLSSKRLSEAVITPEENGKILDDGKAIKVVYSLSNKTYSGNDGEIATINLSFSEDMEEGSYPIYLLDCHSNGIDCVDVPMSDIKATLTLEDYVVGDANGDGQVLVGDVTALLNYIVGRPISNFKENAADVNGDGVILVGDVTALLNIIVNQVSY